jgi:hypothetical protein
MALDGDAIGSGTSERPHVESFFFSLRAHLDGSQGMDARANIEVILYKNACHRASQPGKLGTSSRPSSQ